MILIKNQIINSTESFPIKCRAELQIANLISNIIKKS